MMNAIFTTIVICVLVALLTWVVELTKDVFDLMNRMDMYEVIHVMLKEADIEPHHDKTPENTLNDRKDNNV